MNKIKASVCIVTYNQSAYLRECLESLVCQELDYCYEIIIGDDASTDDTAVVVAEYLDKYPDLIVYLKHKKNIGPTANYISVHSRARGDYIFHMDGDDVALPGKLNKQVALLDSRPDCVLCWHQVSVFDDTGEVKKVLHKELNAVVDVKCITKKDLLKYGMLGAHSSTAYRKSAMPDFKVIEGEVLDYVIVCLILSSGNAARIEEVLGGYRLNPRLTTASKKGSLYFNNSPIRYMYCQSLTYFLMHDGCDTYREEIFFNALFNFFVDVRFLRPSAFCFLRLTVKTASFNYFFKLFDYLRKAALIRR